MHDTFRKSLSLATIALLASLVLAACAQAPSPVPEPVVEPAPAAQDAFVANLRALCGQAFAGTVETDVPATPGNDAFAGQPLVMHMRECTDDELRIPFHVGEDRSRTWVLTRTGAGLRLKHDHRHADGSPDAVTLYGGDTAAAGSDPRQELPVDAEPAGMFGRRG